MIDFSKMASNYIGVKQGSTKHKYIVDHYNMIKPLPRGYKVKYTDNWCATFVSFILWLCGYQKNVFECGAERMRKKMKKYIIKDNTNGKVNDVIFYDWNHDKWCDHVGIISEVTKTSYKVIEGNKDKKVGVRVISKKSPSIFSVAHLK